MAGGGGIMDFVQRYQEYETQRNTTHEFIKDLLIYSEHVESHFREENSRLRQQLNNARLDLDDAAKSRRDLQQRLREAESRAGGVPQDHDDLKNLNPYVLVLIDGDGLLFKDSLVKQGLDGGRKAANQLQQTLAKQFNQTDHIEVIAKVVADVSSLSKAMKRDGFVDSNTLLRDFIFGFNQAKASFDFVDVGQGKERAHLKIQETTKFHLQNYNCKLVLLGLSHDARYAPLIDDLIHDVNTRQRIAVLEGCPTVRDIVSTGVSIVSFNEIFRNERLIDRAPGQIHDVQSMSSAPVVSPTVSYASVTQRASPPPQITLPIAPKSTSTPVRSTKQPPWNPGPRGLDPSIPINQSVLETIKKRKDNNKLCNNHYLRGPCAKGDECCFEHDYNPSKDEKNAIAFLARLNPCTNGQDCDVDNCIYGHHCPSVVNGICTHPYCKFRVDEHPPGTKFKYPRASDS
ncbi:hypothetical protein F4779DRAFT_589245 [Xylariaceae sp. FL0662B]|nr:hypothetical protein F4779DRAFT_589245 [Xylariaceae sp. FL0662B]